MKNILNTVKHLFKEKTPFEKLLVKIKKSHNLTDEKFFFIVKDQVSKNSLFYIVKLEREEKDWLWIEFAKDYSECTLKSRRGKKVIGTIREASEIEQIRQAINHRIDSLYPLKVFLYTP